MQFLTQIRRFFLIALTVLGFSGFLVSTAWSQKTSADRPDALIQSITDALLVAVETDAALASGDMEAIRAYMRVNVLPHIDFEGMAASAVGRPWREATPEQRIRLQAAYETVLLRSYAGALTQLQGRKLEVVPLRAASDETDVVVSSRLVSEEGKPLRLDYRLQKGEEGWKIQDFGVEGIWLNNSYRSQFASIVRKQGLDGLIRLLEKRAKR